MAAINYPVGMPYDELKIYDQSIYKEESGQDASLYTPEGLIVFQPIISERGYDADNELRFITNSSQLDKFGTPNINKYGLSMYFAKNIIKAGANLLTCRLVADNAMPANRCIYAKVKFEETCEIPQYTDREYNGKVYINIPLFDVAGKSEVFKIVDIEGKIRPILKSDMDTGNSITLNTKYVVDEVEHPVDGYVYKYINNEIKYFTSSDDVNGTTLVKAAFASQPRVNISYHTLTVTDTTATNVDDPNLIGRFMSQLTNNGGQVLSDYDEIDFASFAADYTKKDGLEKIEIDTEYVIPLMIVRARCSGTFANNFKFTISPDRVMSTYAYSINKPRSFYTFSSTENGADLDSPITFTFDDNFIYNSESMFVDDVFDAYSKNIRITTMDQWYIFEELIHAFLKDKTNARYNSQLVDIGTIDLLFGTYVDGTVCDFINIDQSEFDFNPSSGCALFGGSDGDFGNVKKWNINDTSDGSDPFAKYFTRAYSGTISDLIFDEVRMPFRMIFSSTLDQNVNDAIHALVNERKSTAAFYTFPTSITTYAESRNFKLNNYSFYSSFKEYFVSEHAYVYDEYTRKRIDMPSTYFNSLKIPQYWINYKGKSFCGINFYWDNYVNGTLLPRTSKIDLWIENHNSGLNTMIEDGKGKASPYEQITAQTPAINSKLSDLNNVITLLEACSIALIYANERHWVEINDEEISDYKTELNDRLNNALGSCYKSIEIQTSQAAQNGAGRNRILCKLYITFKDILKGVSYEFYIL